MFEEKKENGVGGLKGTCLGATSQLCGVLSKPVRSMSKSERLVGLEFNPIGNKVDKVKRLCSELIEILEETPNVVSEETMNLREHALKEVLTAQMWVVKAITYKY